MNNVLKALPILLSILQPSILSMTNPLIQDANAKTALHRAALANNSREVDEELRKICIFYVETFKRLHQGETTISGMNNMTKPKSFGPINKSDKAFLKVFADEKPLIDTEEITGIIEYIMNRVDDICMSVASDVAQNNHICSRLRQDCYEGQVNRCVRDKFPKQVYYDGHGHGTVSRAARTMDALALREASDSEGADDELYQNDCDDDNF